VWACLALLAAGAALADEKKTVKVISSDDDDQKQMKVEVVEEDGKAHVKVWEIEDGKDILVKEYDAGAGDERVLDIDGKHMIFIGGDDDEDCRIKFLDGDVLFDGDLEDAYFLSSGDHDLSWFADGGTYLGVQLSGLNDDQAEYFEVEDGEGALVTEVLADSPAAAAGFQIYDVIVEIDGEKIAEPDAAVKIVRGHEEGDEVEIVVRRRGKNKTLKATLDEREGSAFAYAFAEAPHRAIKHLQDLPEHFQPWMLHRERLMPRPPLDRKELENLRADVEELHAMLEEMKAKQK